MGSTSLRVQRKPRVTRLTSQGALVLLGPVAARSGDGDTDALDIKVVGWARHRGAT